MGDVHHWVRGCSTRVQLHAARQQPASTSRARGTSHLPRGTRGRWDVSLVGEHLPRFSGRPAAPSPSPCGPFAADVTICPQARYGAATLVHWEDLPTRAAFDLLPATEARGAVTLNDDIQGTAAVTLAALLGAQRHPGCPKLTSMDVVMFGAG